MDEMTKIVECIIEIDRQYSKIESDLSKVEDNGLIEFNKHLHEVMSWLLDVGAMEFNEETKEYEATAQIPFKIEWILYLNNTWWLNLEDGIKRKNIKTV